jgi:hypothetical protein
MNDELFDLIRELVDDGFSDSAVLNALSDYDPQDVRAVIAEIRMDAL